ncbi:conserved Plasmodium protein, unknown function [Plasmodium berghei]|uniref:Uncharacterized protein n=2 Tax=Plasmodium berghei TaxID=5821 RepID=A0A509AGZ7_PLABA|nr:conserved Plasmodium protein, unknown function [Plasmodium berghei ANKA]CXI17185.1 conserved Plasmodium protein, unknown function [Plasmodium berghei]SCM19682.1 conserved Plasmodium protein, unknown function [Plasmodium berghei]SCN23426.1 conserved Plasmodium protein, unknown function [Plasmodium berghei]SCO59076.1 conserved Plasmodium protein, unknown function [Plasmodium berghei]SCO59709.1 conserved Plasmodium protein, unknown function [Plasmodium berghei]|eukprot:XP_034420589.1 conserved Plasmodium protein, unknown function [Plasmodium berghei ANKA]
MDGIHINYMKCDKTGNINYEENKKDEIQHQNDRKNENKIIKEYVIWEEKKLAPPKIKNNTHDINKKYLRMNMQVKKESLEKIEPIGYIELVKKKNDENIFCKQPYNDINYNENKKKGINKYVLFENFKEKKNRQGKRNRSPILLEKNHNENIEHYDIMSNSDTILSSDSSLENMYEMSYNYFTYNKNNVENLALNSRGKFISKILSKKRNEIKKNNSDKKKKCFMNNRSNSFEGCNKFLLNNVLKNEEKNSSDSTYKKIKLLTGNKMKNCNIFNVDKNLKKCKLAPFVCKLINCNIQNEEIQITPNTNIIDFNPLTYISNQYMENSYRYIVGNDENNQKNYTPCSYNMCNEFIYNIKNKISGQTNTEPYLYDAVPTKDEEFYFIKNNMMMKYSNNLKEENVMNRLNIKEKKDMKKKKKYIPSYTNSYINNGNNSNIITFIKYDPKKYINKKYITKPYLYKDIKLSNETSDIKNNFQLKKEYKNYLNNLICYTPKHNKNVFYKKKKNFKKNKIYKKNVFENIFRKIKLLSYAIFFCFFISSKNRSIKEQKKK